MRIHIGSDHAGLELKAALVDYLQSKGHDVKDHGPHEYDAVDECFGTVGYFCSGRNIKYHQIWNVAAAP